jgi:hypothetical protein
VRALRRAAYPVTLYARPVSYRFASLSYEGVVSKTVDAPYAPRNRGLWRKAKCLDRQEFVVVGWTDPEGSRPHLGALLLGYYGDDCKLGLRGPSAPACPKRCLRICDDASIHWRIRNHP